MATVKKGTITRSPEWWRHLRWTKRKFWKSERRAVKQDTKEQVREDKAS